jgi:hypothetical protein
MVWFIVDVVTSECSIVTRWMLVNSCLGCFVLGKVSFGACVMVGVLVRGAFLKDGGKNAFLLCCESVAVCVVSKLVTILTVGYCVRNKM